MSFANKARKILKEMKEDNCEICEKSEERPLPFFDLDGSLIIPFGCDPRFHYWNGGESISETEEEMKTMNIAHSPFSTGKRHIH